MNDTFSYAAYTPEGDVEKGEVEAVSLQAAASSLAARELIVFEINPKSSGATGLFEQEFFVTKGLKPAEKEQLLRLLSSLVEAKLPIDQALRSISSKTDKSRLSAMVSRLHERVIGGQALSDAFGAEGDTLPPSWEALVRAGESSGQLDQVLKELAVEQERSNRISAEVRSALIYPTLLGGLAVMTVGFIIVVLLPALGPLIDETGGSLPAPVAVLMGVSESLRAAPFLWALGLLIFVFASVQTFRNEAFRTGWSQLGLRLPLIGNLLRQLNTARICSTLGLLLSNRVEQLRAVSITGTVVTHDAYKELLKMLYEHIQEGGALSRGLEKDDLVPEQVLNLVLAGEKTGRIAEMLLAGAKLMEDGSKRTLDRLVALLTPALTLVLGVVIGGIVLSVMTTLMSVNNAAFS